MARSTRLSLDTFILIIFLITFDLAIMTPILPAITRTFHLSIRWSMWVLSLYMILFSLALPLIDSLMSRIGRNRVYLLSLLAFGGGSLLVSISGHWTAVIWGRMIQAIGTAGIISYGSVEIRRFLNRQPEGRREIVWLMMGGILILTPIFSSFMVRELGWKLGWRALFFNNIFVSLFLLFLFKRQRGVERATGERAVDRKGIFLFAVLLFFAMLAVSNTRLSTGWRSFLSPTVIPYWIISLGLVVILLMIERLQRFPLFEIQLWRVWLLYVYMFVTGFSWMALVIVPEWLLHLFHLGAIWGGLILCYLLSGLVIAFPLMHRLSLRWSFRQISLIGFFCSTLAYLCLIWLTNKWMILLALGVLGASISFTLMAPVYLLLVQSLPRRKIRNTLTILGMFRTAGGAIGLLITASLFSFLNPSEIGWFVSHTAASPLTELAIRRVMQFSAGMAAVGLLLSLVLPFGRLKSVAGGRGSQRVLREEEE